MDKQLKSCAFFLMLVLAAESVLLTCGSAPVAHALSPNSFSIMQITDTQFLSSTYPSLYNALCSWIVNNSATYNLKMVIHTGDITDQYYDSAQWINANSSMQILTNSSTPYLWCAGNHDQTGFSDPTTGWAGNQYSAFNPVNFQGKSYWVSDYSQGKNTAVKFTVGNYCFLVVDAESTPCTDGDIAWMTGLFGNYSAQDYNIIFATHALLACDGAWDNGLSNNPAYQDPTWEINLQNLLNNYTRVFMTLNGHSSDVQGTAYHNVVNGRVQIQFDRQDADGERGACSVRIYTFNLDNQTVNVSTYSVWNGTWLADPNDCFSFSTNLVPDPSVNISPTSVRMYVGQSQTFVSSVLGGVLPYTYQWVLNDTMVSGATGSNWTFCAKQVGNYRVYLNVTDSSGQRIQSNVASDIHVYSVNLLLIAGMNASAFKKGQSVTLEVEVLNQMNPALLSTLTLTVTGPCNYCYYDFQPINVTANAAGDYCFTWNIPNISGTYVVGVGLAPAQLTAYDVAWLRVN